jgi:anion-transporting  ArsA/GET3 family ATPase
VTGPLAGLDGRPLVLVTGKGGVGRSAVTAALARHATANGRRVLAVDAVGDGGLARSLGVAHDRSSGGRARGLDDGTTLLELATEASLDEYLRLQLHLPFTASVGPLSRVVEFVAAAAPAVREILTIGKIGYEVRQGRWDTVVVDAPASGHVIELLAAPNNLGDFVTVGPLAEQTAWLRALLADPEITTAVVVTLPEELAVAEAFELRARIEAETDVVVGPTVVNRVPERPPAGALDPVVDDPRWGPVARLVRQRSNQAELQLERLLEEVDELVLVPDADTSALAPAEVCRWIQHHLHPVHRP